ncbi:MAG: hypothetical protein ACRDUV_07405, partial [Pseudonocardiaceae bacterium]
CHSTTTHLLTSWPQRRQVTRTGGGTVGLLIAAAADLHRGLPTGDITIPKFRTLDRSSTRTGPEAA